MAQTRVNRVLVANSGAANTGTTLPTIANSDILIFDRAFGTAETGSPSPTAVNNDKIYIAQGLATGTGNCLMGAPNGILSKSISRITASAYVAPTAKVIAIGFNGTSGNIVAPTNNTTYKLNIVFNDDQRPGADQRQTRRSYVVTTDSSATAQEVIDSLIKQVNTDKYMQDKITANELTNGTFTALTNNATVILGNVSVTSTAHGLVAGDTVRIGGTGATIPVYQVASAPDANTIILTSPYQGASATVLAANIGKITAVTSTGIRLTAKSIPFNGIDLFMNINFDAFLTNEFSTTAESKTVLTNFGYGQGYWQIVRDMEYMAQGYLTGPVNRTMFPDANVNGLSGPYPTRAVAGGQYSLVTIEYFDKHEGDLTDQFEAPCSLTVAFDVSSATTKRDAFMTTLASITGVGIQQNF